MRMSSLFLAPTLCVCVATAAHADSRPTTIHLIPESTQRSFAPIPSGEWSDVELIVNNNAIAARELLVRLYSRGRATDVTLTVPPTSPTFVRLSGIVPHEMTVAAVDGVELQFVGRLLEIGAQLTLLQPQRGTVDVPFSMVGDFRSSTLNPVWKPVGGATSIVIANTQSSVAIVNVTRDGHGGERLELAAHENRTVIVGDGVDAEDARSMKIVAQAPPGAIRAFGFTRDGRARVRGTIAFYDPASARRSSLFAQNVNVRSGAPVLSIKNTSPDPVTVYTRVAEAGGQGSEIEEPAMVLQPYESKSVSLTSTAGAQFGSGRASVQVTSSGSVGALVGSVSSFDVDRSLAYDVPLRDPGPARHSTGSYPWRVDGDFTTTVSITNVTDTTAEYRAVITYEGGSQSLRPGQVKPGETMLFDLREVIGKIPEHPTMGQFRWSIVNSQGATKLVGRAELISESQNRVSSYSCATCCGWTSMYGDFEPLPVGVNVGDESQGSVTETWMDCYGYTTPHDAYADWWDMSDWSVASVWSVDYGVAAAQGNDGGLANATGYWGSEYWWDANDDEYNPMCFFAPFTQFANGQVKSRKPTSLSVASDAYQSAPPGYRYDRLRRYHILDQDGQQMSGNLSVTESYSPNPASGNCGSGSVTTGGTVSAPDGGFWDHYAAYGGAPNPCASFSTQTHTVNGFNVGQRSVTWFYDSVSVSP